MRTLRRVLGSDISLVELSREDVVSGWRASGFSDEDIAFFLRMRTDPPEAGRTVQPTVADVTGRPAMTFADWVRQNAAPFRPQA